MVSFTVRHLWQVLSYFIPCLFNLEVTSKEVEAICHILLSHSNIFLWMLLSKKVIFSLIDFAENGLVCNSTTKNFHIKFVRIGIFSKIQKFLKSHISNSTKHAWKTLAITSWKFRVTTTRVLFRDIFLLLLSLSLLLSSMPSLSLAHGGSGTGNLGGIQRWWRWELLGGFRRLQLFYALGFRFRFYRF